MFWIYSNFKKKNNGQSLVEIIIAVSIISVIFVASVSALVTALRSNRQTAKQATASFLAQELLDEVHSVSEGYWPSLYNVTGGKGSTSTYHIVGTSTLSIATSAENIGENGIVYSCWFSVENVNRDSNGNIATSTGTEDPSTQKVTVYVNWRESGATSSINIVEYLTRFANNQATVFTTWSGSSSMAGPITVPSDDYWIQSGTMDATSTAGKVSIVAGTTTAWLESNTFNTGISGGVKINSIMWQGVLNGGTVKFQIASANCSNGATNPESGCTSSVGWGGSKVSGDGAFVGSGGTSGTFYEKSGSPANTLYTVSNDQHNNKRYFRYRIYLQGATSPVVEDVIINWSP
jgi:Tfp pilus assembly protein PilV